MKDNTIVTTKQNGSPTKKRSQWAEVWRRLKKNKMAMFGMFVILLLIVLAFTAEIVAPHGPSTQTLDNVRQVPDYFRRGPFRFDRSREINEIVAREIVSLHESGYDVIGKVRDVNDIIDDTRAKLDKGIAIKSNIIDNQDSIDLATVISNLQNNTDILGLFESSTIDHEKIMNVLINDVVAKLMVNREVNTLVENKEINLENDVKEMLNVIRGALLEGYEPAELVAETVLTKVGMREVEKSFFRVMIVRGRHFLGTDDLGRDILSRIIHGARVSLLVGFLAISASVLVGGSLGAVAGFYGGKLDNVIMRSVDVLLAIPSILLAIAIVSAFGGGIINLMIAVGISYVPTFARIVKASVISIKEQEFIEAARAIGANDLRIILKHILPNSMAPIIVQGTLGVAGAILSAAGLSFLGMGVKPPTPEWGAMLSSGRTILREAPHVATFPGLAIMLTIFALNLFGDGLRDALDPRLRE